MNTRRLHFKIQSINAVLHFLPNFFFLTVPLGLLKITADPHSTAHVNTDCTEDRYPKLKIFISELTLDSYQYITIVYVTMRSLI